MKTIPLAALSLLLAVPASQAQTASPVASPAAEAYAEGQKHLASRTTAELRAARESFERAIAADATFAPAFAGLAEAHALLYDYSRAKEAAGRALSLDDRLADAHAVLAFARLHGDWDWAGAEAEFKRALELDSRRPITHLWYAILLEATASRNRRSSSTAASSSCATGKPRSRASPTITQWERSRRTPPRSAAGPESSSEPRPNR